MREKKKILITVKTYPTPSSSHRELVCTAGVLEDGSFIRLYPIGFRDLESSEQFKKYQWIEVDVERRTEDSRPESFTPFMSTMRSIGPALPTDKYWEERRVMVLKKTNN